MYTFELHYIDVDTGRDIIKTLKVDSQLYGTKKKYLYTLWKGHMIWWMNMNWLLG